MKDLETRRCAHKAGRFLLLCLMPASALSAQRTAPKPPEQNLRLAIAPGGPYRGAPRAFTVWLTNTTDHIVRLPQPLLNCGAIPTGSLHIYSDFQPSRPVTTPLSGRGCSADFAHPSEPILMQIASWETLLPGQSIAFPMAIDLATPPLPGVYKVSAGYTPPYVLPAEHDQLTLRGIDIPNAELVSATLTYTVRTP